MRRVSAFSHAVGVLSRLLRKSRHESEDDLPPAPVRSTSFEDLASPAPLPRRIGSKDKKRVHLDPVLEEEMDQLTTDDEEIDIRGDPTSLPPTLYVLEFAAGVPAATIDWYIGRVQGRRRTGGAELLVSAQPQLDGKGLVLHLTASRMKLLETAERMEIRKKDRAGFLRDFTCAELDEFLDESGVDGLLTMCEKQKILLHELEHIRARSTEDRLPGYPRQKLYPGQSVTRLLLQEDIITRLFPVHDPEELERLGKSWYAALFQRQPFEDIRAYFGESVALYFSFLGFYTAALCGPAALGVIQLVFSVDTLHEYALYSLFNMLWVTIFLEAWKRKCNELAYVWGVMDKTQMSFLEPRANHRGEMVRDEITGRYMPYYPRWKTLVKLYTCSIPMVAVCLFVSFYLMLVSFWAEEYLTLHRDQYGGNLVAVLIMLPSIIYSVAVLVMNKYYNKLSTVLTEWENHRTQKQFDYYRVIKLALFEFVNSFMSLFYIAFYIQDLEMLKGVAPMLPSNQLCLRQQLAVMLIIQQLVNNFQEALLPLVIRKTYSKVEEKVLTKLKEHKLTRKLFESRALDAVDADDARVRVKTLEPDDPRVLEVNQQLQLEPYPDAPEDYLEMYVQFGYAFLFSSVFPMAAFWAVANNLLEIRADAFKLCKVYQRPPAKSVRNIGAWMPAFEVLGFIAVFTNCALLCMSPALRRMAPGLTPVEWVVVFVLLEHTLLALKLTLTQVVPNVPSWIRKAVAQQEYTAKQMLHKKRRRDTRHRLSRRFSTKPAHLQRPASHQPETEVRFRNH